MLLRQSMRHAHTSTPPPVAAKAVLMTTQLKSAADLGHATRRWQLLVVIDIVLEALEVAGVGAHVLPALGVAVLVAAAELGHGRHLPRLAAGQQEHSEQEHGRGGGGG